MHPWINSSRNIRHAYCKNILSIQRIWQKIQTLFVSLYIWRNSYNPFISYACWYTLRQGKKYLKWMFLMRCSIRMCFSVQSTVLTGLRFTACGSTAMKTLPVCSRMTLLYRKGRWPFRYVGKKCNQKPWRTSECADITCLWFDISWPSGCAKTAFDCMWIW